jgi:hypothetical protein
VADVIRAAGESFFEPSQKWFTWLHLESVERDPALPNSGARRTCECVFKVRA